jgi:UDP-N-acetyl-2-amino-2-deoxyglucuronate dehydrogenase
LRRPIRVGLVGLGAVGLVHLEAYRAVTGIELIGVADTNPGRVAFAKERLGLCGYSTLAELLHSAKPELCCILTPPAAHMDAVLQCADAGVHVLCEKPMALSVSDCEAMIDACRRNNVLLCYGASYRYLPAVMTARDMVLRGELGDVILLCEIALGGRGPNSRASLSPSHYPVGGPGGSSMGLCDHGIHLIDAFGWMMNSAVKEVWGRGNISGQPLRPECAYLRYTNDAVGQLLYEDGTFSSALPYEGVFAWGVGWSLEPSRADAVPGQWQSNPGCIQVFGTKGSLRVFHYANALFCRDGNGLRQIEIPNRPVPANFTAQMQALVDAISSGRPAPVPGEAGLSACRALLALYGGSLVPV